MKLAIALSLALLVPMSAAHAAEPLVVGAGDTIEKVVAAQTGKVVTLRLSGSDEITGKVKFASADVVHLTELSGKEFYDAAVSTRSIAAVLVRAR